MNNKNEMADKLARNAIEHMFIHRKNAPYKDVDDLYEDYNGDLITYKDDVLRQYKLLYEYYYDKILNDSL